MKLHCPLSGISYQADTFSDCTMNCAHPIFSLTPKQLARIASQHMKGKLTRQESRLLCLALWHTTGLVSVVEPIPSDYSSIKQQEPAIAESIPLLLDFHSFLESRTSSQLKDFPHIIANASSSHDLKIILNSLQVWNGAITEYFTSYHAARLSLIEAQKRNFLEHLAAFSSRKPKRYIRALSRYVIESLPANLWDSGDAREHDRYIIEYSGLVHTLETRPIQPITKGEIEALMDKILTHLDLDNLHVWKSYKALEQFLNSGHYSVYGVSLLTSEEAEKEEAEKTAKKAEIIALLGARPTDFIGGIQYDAKVIQLLSQ